MEGDNNHAYWGFLGLMWGPKPSFRADKDIEMLYVWLKTKAINWP
jgi:hypothetical protein